MNIRLISISCILLLCVGVFVYIVRVRRENKSVSIVSSSLIATSQLPSYNNSPATNSSPQNIPADSNTIKNSQVSVLNMASKLILSQLQQKFPSEGNNFVLADPTDDTTFYIAINSDPAFIDAYDASLDSQFKSEQTIAPLTSADTPFSYTDSNSPQNGLLLFPLKVENDKLIFAKIPNDWSPSCESTLLAFKDHLYSISLDSKGMVQAQQYTATQADISYAQNMQTQCERNGINQAGLVY